MLWESIKEFFRPCDHEWISPYIVFTASGKEKHCHKCRKCGYSGSCLPHKYRQETYDGAHNECGLCGRHLP